MIAWRLISYPSCHRDCAETQFTTNPEVFCEMVKEFITEKCEKEIIRNREWDYVMALNTTELLAKFGLPGFSDLFEEFEGRYDGYRRFYEIETIEILV